MHPRCIGTLKKIKKIDRPSILEVFGMILIRYGYVDKKWSICALEVEGNWIGFGYYPNFSSKVSILPIFPLIPI